MRRLLCLLSVAAALVIFCSPAEAHGIRNTADGPDEGHSIQFYASSQMMLHPGFADAIDAWNNVPGPKLKRVATQEEAELIYFFGYPCTEPIKNIDWYGGVAWHDLEGKPTICLTQTAADGHIWSYVQFLHLVEHETGHKFGEYHHSCDDSPETVMNICQPLRYGITRHDRRWKRGYVAYYNN